ncbi:transposase for insertion sequence element IS801 [groundwater metagenome]
MYHYLLAESIYPKIDKLISLAFILVCVSKNKSQEINYNNNHKKSITITITIALILFTYGTWEEYQIRNKDSLRQVVIENVERFRNCRKPQNGYKVYQCPECGKKKYVPFTCKSRLCTSCGTKAANEWADQIYHKLLKEGYRHTQTEFHETVIVLIKRSWREEIKKTFEYDPLICPHCNTEMELIGICYEGTESYPTDDPQPVKPPPNIKFSQQERMQLIKNSYSAIFNT